MGGALGSGRVVSNTSDFGAGSVVPLIAAQKNKAKKKKETPPEHKSPSKWPAFPTLHEGRLPIIGW